MADFSTQVRSGEWKGYSGKRIRNIINIGIGGFDLEPVMAYQALQHYNQRDLTVPFVSNIDGTAFVEATRDLTDVIEGVPFNDGLRADDNTDLTPQ